ncbi:efflux RND transporter periplasmic adaptor subunit [Thiolapillus brandeum]|uniref:RND efflux transporter MFP subunit n=1 Tax=Thiolapillus brandeum TaxID=1076588 RepID=A0A7U6JJD6_9GAMM|nr:efflux RND transporter periplasmic adaptor subunit [Thiolapillus brandeum]BAO44905.1 RND efflux transporter MFP subunit [Thiolapillus brandeum]
MKRPNRHLVYTAFAVFLVASVVALILLKGPLAPIPVKIVKLQQGDLHPAIFGVGTVEALRSYRIGPTRSGRLLKLLVDHGDHVQKGQLLGEMDPVDLPERLKAAALNADKVEHLVEAAEAAVDDAREHYQQAQKEAIRYRKLVEKRQVSQELAESRESEARAAADKLREMQANLAGVKHDLERASEEYKALQAQLADMKLISPQDGMVTAREVEPGSVIVAGTPVLRMIDPASLWIRTRIDQAKTGRITVGQSADIQLRSHPQETRAGSVKRVELIADSLTEERWVDVGFDQIPKGLSIGMLANVTIHLAPVPQADWLPSAAIAYQQGQPGAWVVRKGRVVFLPLETGIHTLDGKTQITGGLEKGENVAIYPQKPLKEGDRVKETADD